MMNFDVFNGDADGICALHQLRLAFPRDSRLVTGVKRDIALLERVEAAAGDHVTVLDISLDKNRAALLRVLNAGATVRYFDHHFAGEIPDAAGLETHIDPDPEVCTSLLVDSFLGGRFRPWAVVGAFGDNLAESARRAAQSLRLSEQQLRSLAELGICLNYNGYGVELSDLFFPPDELYRLVHRYRDPFDFIAGEPGYSTLREGYKQDMRSAADLNPQIETESYSLFILPDKPWARRVSGVFGNELAGRYPRRAHALLTELGDGDFRVSVRAPLVNKSGADELCRAFPTGGGRKGAAGINRLAGDDYDVFVERFKKAYG